MRRWAPLRTITTNRAASAEREGGFTLLELLVVLAILGLLAAIVAPQVLGYLRSSRTQVAKVQVENISAALDHFQLDTGRYPTEQEGLAALVRAPGDLPNWNGPYLKRDSALIDPWRRPYLYKNPGKHGEVDVWSYGADGVEGGEKDARDVGDW
jgi:general secretion pathway protein G